MAPLPRSVAASAWGLLVVVILHNASLPLAGVIPMAMAAETPSAPYPDVALTTDSVVLITGAAGFMGSELALALHRTYGPRKLILIDSMDRGFGGVTPESVLSGLPPHKTEADLALLEVKRQRVFRVLQEVGPNAHFYRVDFRPNVPEFFEAGEVPVLHHILTIHADVTHVVHLADHYHRGSTFEKRKEDQLLTQMIPRIHGQPKAGMMESLLEELRVLAQQGKAPHFLYASSHEVYNIHRDQDPHNPPPFAEHKPLSTPSSFAGASKLMDEVLAQTYFQTEQILSVGLRFFSVYGPWGLPGSPLYEMAERAVRGERPLGLETDIRHDIRDLVYIDDAVDAIMTAMQFRHEAPVVFNVGSGQGTTLLQVGQIMDQLVRGTPTISSNVTVPPPDSVSIADTHRAEKVLGFQTRVPLEEGVERLLAWHHDRAYPYGAPPNNAKTHRIAAKGMAACHKYDTECLLGTTVFPCASECAHETQCITSFLDDVMAYTRLLTEECNAVMYTVALDEDLSVIPSAQVQVSANSRSHIEGNGGQCNLAFVSESSPLFRRLSSNQASQGKELPVMHGHWVLIPVTISSHIEEIRHILELVPKLSPGQFFGSKTTAAIYCDPNVVLDNVALILAEFEKSPTNESGNGATAILIGERRGGSDHTFESTMTTNERVQNTAYRMIRIAAMDELTTEGFSSHVESTFMVHALKNEDSRLFRCDIFGEVVQWNVASDTAAIEFIAGLHDMWSRVVQKKRDFQPWWAGDNVSRKSTHQDEEKSTKTKDSGHDKKQGQSAQQRRRLQEVRGTEDFLGQGHDTGGGGMSEAIQDAVRAVFGESINRQVDREDDDGDDDDSVKENEQDADLQLSQKIADGTVRIAAQGSAGSETWLEVLSSAENQYYTHIVEASKLGVVHLDDFIG